MQPPGQRNDFLAWLLLGSLAAVVCSLPWPAAHLGDELLPVGIDSFYHARRILDTAADPSSFYEFDPRIHAPEGSLLTWPWAYDYSLGLLLRFAMQLGFVSDPMALLIWIPVACVFISVGLVLLISRRLSLSTSSTILAGFCVALSPLTQFLHGVGSIDHHYAEYIFVLLTLAQGLSWFAELNSVRRAIILGIVLGVAPSIHNGLFILQAPVLLSLFILWLQGVEIPRRATTGFALALTIATTAVLLPSLPFRLDRFEFYTLSWFHFYIAVCSAATAALMATMRSSSRGILILTTVSILLLIPIGRQVLIAQSFLEGSIIRLDSIHEMNTLSEQMSAHNGLRDVWNFYSLFAFAVPATFAYCMYRGWKERRSARIVFWTMSLFGLALLVLQFRLHYFGSFALYLPWLIFLDNLLVRHPKQRKQVLLIAVFALIVIYFRPLRYQLPAPWPAANDPTFKSLRPLLSSLHKECATYPGVTLADNDVGHYIRYYTDCSVLANNFLLTPQHADKIEQMDRLLALPASALPQTAPYVRYVLIRPLNIVRTDQGSLRYIPFSHTGEQLMTDLLLSGRSSVPASYELLDQVLVPGVDNVPYARLFAVEPTAESR